MTTYYHGTSEKAANCIEKEGFRGSELDDCTVGRLVDNGVVFLADCVELAKGYGNTIVAVETSRAVFYQECPVTGHKEYYVSISDLEEEGAWWSE